MAGETEASMSVADPQTEDIPLLCNVGRRGNIKGILPELDNRGICVKWTQFSLKQMCSFKLQWDQDIILMYYYLSTYYAVLKNTTSPFKFDLEPCYLSEEQYRESEAQ